MPQLDALLIHTLMVYIAEIGVIGLLVFGGIRYVIQNKPNSDAMGILVCILCVILCVILIRNIIPFTLDYLGNDVRVTQGVYENKIGNNSTSGSTGLGFYAVRIHTYDQEILDLTTIPLVQNGFPVGKFHVKAYYTLRSQMLVYVEILEQCS